MSGDCDKFAPLVREWLRATESGRLQAAAAIRRRAIEEARWAAANLVRNTPWAVFPCRMPDKEPVTPHSFYDAVRDPDSVAELWRQHPGDLVGIRTGEASGIDVLDVDIKHPTACAWWHRHEHLVPDTRTYRSLRGGFHLYFEHAPGVRNDQGKKVCEGIDVRGEGGLIIHWFSAGCECLDNAPPVPWPDWLLEIVRPPPQPMAPPRPLTRPYTGPDKGLPALLHRVVGAAEGQRNGILHWASCRLAERILAGRIGRAQAEAELLRAALSCGLLEPEARRTIQSGLRSVP